MAIANGARESLLALKACSRSPSGTKTKSASSLHVTGSGLAVVLLLHNRRACFCE